MLSSSALELSSCLCIHAELERLLKERQSELLDKLFSLFYGARSLDLLSSSCLTPHASRRTRTHTPMANISTSKTVTSISTRISETKPVPTFVRSSSISKVSQRAPRIYMCVYYWNCKPNYGFVLPLPSALAPLHEIVHHGRPCILIVVVRHILVYLLAEAEKPFPLIQR